MPTWLWIIIGIAAFVILVAVAFSAVRTTRERRMMRKRTQAQELRGEAQSRLARAGEREAVAQQEMERARRERGAAEEAGQRAADIDPNMPDAPRETAGTRRG